LQYILAQTAKLVPTNLLNVETALKKIDELNQNTPPTGKKWALMSLDVKSLYPSIPITKGIEEIIKFLADKIDEVDTLGISLANIKLALEFVCTNYEVEFNNKAYLQTVYRWERDSHHLSPLFTWQQLKLWLSII
jgi:hypothetical protein